MCSSFWVAAPHAYETDVLSPHLCISAPNCPSPALRRFRVIHNFRGKSDSGGAGRQLFRELMFSPLFVPGLNNIVVAVMVFCYVTVERSGVISDVVGVGSMIKIKEQKESTKCTKIQISFVCDFRSIIVPLPIYFTKKFLNPS